MSFAGANKGSLAAPKQLAAGKASSSGGFEQACRSPCSPLETVENPCSQIAIPAKDGADAAEGKVTDAREMKECEPPLARGELGQSPGNPARDSFPPASHSNAALREPEKQSIGHMGVPNGRKKSPRPRPWSTEVQKESAKRSPWHHAGAENSFPQFPSPGWGFGEGTNEGHMTPGTDEGSQNSERSRGKEMARMYLQPILTSSPVRAGAAATHGALAQELPKRSRRRLSDARTLKAGQEQHDQYCRDAPTHRDTAQQEKILHPYDLEAAEAEKRPEEGEKLMESPASDGRAFLNGRCLRRYKSQQVASRPATGKRKSPDLESLAPPLARSPGGPQTLSARKIHRRTSKPGSPSEGWIAQRQHVEAWSAEAMPRTSPTFQSDMPLPWKRSQGASHSEQVRT